MPDRQSIINSLLLRASNDLDPTMLTVLQAIADELLRIGLLIDPAPFISSKISSVAANVPAPVTTLSYELTSTNVILTWEPPSDSFLYYEIRIGDTWETASRLLITSNLQAILDPLSIGSHTYLIKSLSSTGDYSVETDSVDVLIPALGPIILSVTQIDTNVLLKWNTPTSTFSIDKYVITKNGDEVGEVKGTFFAIFETVGGTFEYGIIGYDIAGNVTAESVISVIVTDPADFIFRASFTSAFSGTKVNAKSQNDSLLVCVDTTITYRHHFLDNAWANYSAQIAAGYSRWITPAETTASYKEVFDCGLIYTNTIITLAWATSVVSGSFTIGSSTRVSDDGISWSSPETTTSFFVTSVRYIEVTINFTGADDKSLLKFYNFQVSVSVKQEMDSGSVAAISSDVGGTVVTFNKAFKDIDSITATVVSASGVFTVIVDFTDIPNPVDFAVLVYNSAGVRVSKTVYWKARGII